MKICVISTPVFRLHPPVGVTGYGGLEPLAWLIAKGLAEKGHQVALVAPDGSECPGVDIIPTGPERTVDEHAAYNKFWQHLLAFNDGVVVDNSWAKWSFQLKAEGKLLAPILSVCHAPVNTMFSSWPPTFPNLPPVVKACPVAISKDQATHFESLFNSPCRVAYNGTDVDNYYKPIDIPRTKRFLFLARFSTIKGADLAIEACKKAGVGLDLIGDTTITNEPEYFAKCKAMADGEQIRIIGGVTRGNTVWWYSQAHCLVHLNLRFREPFGLSIQEAQGCKCPVIGWRYGSLSEVVKEGETGWLVSSMEEAVEIINKVKDDGISDEMRNRCREWSFNFNVAKMVDRYEELCEEALRKPW